MFSNAVVSIAHVLLTALVAQLSSVRSPSAGWKQALCLTAGGFSSTRARPTQTELSCGDPTTHPLCSCWFERKQMLILTQQLIHSVWRQLRGWIWISFQEWISSNRTNYYRLSTNTRWFRGVTAPQWMLYCFSWLSWGGRGTIGASNNNVAVRIERQGQRGDSVNRTAQFLPMASLFNRINNK